jgi:hypothetical protein
MTKRIWIAWLALFANTFLPLTAQSQIIQWQSQREIPTVTYCALINNFKQYDKKIIRIRAIYVYRGWLDGVYISGGGPYLRDSECTEGKPPQIIWKLGEYLSETSVSTHRSWEANSDPAIVKAFRLIQEADQQVDITAIGMFSGPRKDGYGHHGSSKFHFEIRKLEEARMVQTEPISR